MAAQIDKILYERLKELEVIPTKDLDQAYELSKNLGTKFVDILIDKDLVSNENLGELLADIYNVPFIRLSQEKIDKKVLNIIPEIVARKQEVIAFKKDNKGVHVGMVNPNDQRILDFLKKKIEEPVKIYLATKWDVKNSLNFYGGDMGEVFEKMINDYGEEARGKVNNESQIINIVDSILKYGYANKASDIHIEPHEDKFVIRFRVDSVLHDTLFLPMEIHERVVSRIKVMSKMRIDEHQEAQDGKMEYVHEGDGVDIRVSIVPTVSGEKVVMRLLSETSRQYSLSDLGIRGEDLTRIEKAYKKPFGMILTTGPTGCGKTTTLYAILKKLNQREVNIATIEDPVEYDIEGVNQIQVNNKTDLTFAKGLRSIVRQDPDIILVGEIRDNETASIAVNAAMTGHLVLSTLHTNDAATAIPRLIDMKIEPFLIASSAQVIIAQRLVRKICSKCRTSKEITAEEMDKYLSKEMVTEHFGNKKKYRFYEGKGCPVCHNTGYAGRVGIFEVMLLSDEIRAEIVEKKDAGVIKEMAVKQGMRTMMEDGFEKVKEGLTTIEELMRVVVE